MNIADKERLYAEAFRALRPGGRLALHEIMAGPAQPIHFPVPWAPDASISFLRPPEAVRALLAAMGFRELVWEDVSARTAGWLQERGAAARAAAPPPIGFHLLLGENAGAALGNVLRNLLEERVRTMEAVFARP